MKRLLLALFLLAAPISAQFSIVDGGGAGEPAPWSDSVLYYDFEEEDGRDLCGDVRGNFNATETNSPVASTTSPPRGAQWFEADGTTPSGAACSGTWTGSPLNSASQDFTVAWIGEADALTGSTDFFFDFGGGGQAFKSFITSTDDLRIRGGNSARTVDATYTFGSQFSFCVTYDDSSSQWNIYDSSGGSTPIDTWTANHQANSGFTFGSGDGEANGMDGRLDELYIWDRTLSGTECGSVVGGKP